MTRRPVRASPSSSREPGTRRLPVGTFEEASRILRTNPPDLLIADVRLGPFNGLQLVISSPQPIPAIIITGFADPVLEADARRRGADYVLKPVSPGARAGPGGAETLVAARVRNSAHGGNESP